jgi:hypothetical protein
VLFRSIVPRRESRGLNKEAADAIEDKEEA